MRPKLPPPAKLEPHLEVFGARPARLPAEKSAVMSSSSRLFPAVRVQDGLWWRSGEGDNRTSLPRSEGDSANDRPPELDAVDTLFEEGLGGTSGGYAENEAEEAPDVDAFEYMPQGLRLSYCLRTACLRVQLAATASLLPLPQPGPHSVSRG